MPSVTYVVPLLNPPIVPTFSPGRKSLLCLTPVPSVKTSDPPALEAERAPPTSIPCPHKPQVKGCTPGMNEEMSLPAHTLKLPPYQRLAPCLPGAGSHSRACPVFTTFRGRLCCKGHSGSALESIPYKLMHKHVTDGVWSPGSRRSTL